MSTERRLIVMDVHGLFSYPGMPEYVKGLRDEGDRIIFWTKGRRAVDVYRKLAEKGFGEKWSLRSEIISRIPFSGLRTEAEEVIAKKSIPVVASDTIRYFKVALARYRDQGKISSGAEMVIQRFYTGRNYDFLERFSKWAINKGDFYKDPSIFANKGEKFILIESDEADKHNGIYLQRRYLGEWDMEGLDLIIMPEKRAISEEKQVDAMKALKTFLELWRESHIGGLKADIPKELGLSNGKLYGEAS